MRSPLLSRIAALRGRVRRQLALHGLGLVVAGTALYILLAGLADWAIHLAREIRVALLLGLVGLIVYLVIRYVIRPLVVRFRDLDIAMKVERRWPGLNDRLASTVQFLEMSAGGEGDRADILGSKALRDATVAQTLAETDAIDFREVIDPRPVRKAGLVAAAALASGFAVFAADPRLGAIAMERLFRPFSATAWPQMTHLAILKAPAKVARGEPFALEVGVAQGERAPGTAKITYRHEDGEVVTESLRPDDRNRFHGRKESVEKSFTFTVTAGDDQTKSRAVTVVPPPVVTDVAVRLTFPPYTGLPPQRLAPGKTQVQAVLGTTVEIEASANKPLASATLVRGEGQPPLEASVDASQTKFRARFDLDESGPATLALKDTEGFSSQEKDEVRFDLRAVADEAPRVVIDEPTADRDVTPNADVPIAIAAEDDFGLGVIRLVHKAASNGSEPSPEVVVPLWAVDPAEDGKPASAVKTRAVRHVLMLEPLNLQPGSLVTLYADARDLFKRGELGPNTGKSRELHLRIVSPDQIAVQLDEQRRAIHEEIDRALSIQKQAIQPVEDAIRTLDRGGKLDEAGREDVHNAETIQRQLSGRITGSNDGLDQKIARYLEDLKNLKIDAPDARTQMQDLQGGVDKIREENLDPAEKGLSLASKALDNQAGRPDRAATKAGAEPEAPDGKTSDESDGDIPKADQAKDSEKADGAEKDSAKSGSSKAKVQSKAGQPKAKTQSKAGQPKGDQAEPGEDSGADTGDSPEAAPGDEGDQPKANAGGAQPKGASTKSSPSTKGDTAKPKPGKQSPAKDALAQAEKNQKAIANELERMRDSLGEFETYKGVVQDAKKLLKEQEDAMKAAAEAAANPDLTAKTPEALTPEQRADLANVAARQAEVSKELARLENKMDEMAGRLNEADPLSASALKEAAQESRQRGTSGKMDEAASGIEQNKLGEAQAGQKQAQKDLKKLVDALNNRRENELARLVKELKAAEKAMNDLRDKQAQNRDQTAKAKQMADAEDRKEQLQKLSKEQKQIQEELKDQLLKLRKLRADAAAQAGARAESQMGQAGQEQEDGDADEAEQAQEEALANLDEAQDEIEQARRDAEEQLAMEQLSKIKDNLQALAERQDRMVEETSDYDKARAEKGLTLAQRASVRTLGRVQDTLKDETTELTERLDSAPAFALTLKKAEGQMDEAARRLQSLKTDDDTQDAEKSAARRVKQLIEALKPDPAEGGAGQQQGGGGGGGQQGGARGGGDGIGLASQLKVLKMLQQEVNDRTEALDEIRNRKKELNPSQQAELDGLADEQRAIADIARDLTKPKKADGEE